MRLKEFGKFENLEVESVSDFRAFLNESWKKRYSFYDDRTLFDEEVTYREQQFLTFDGNLIKARNYVGFIQYQGDSITIYPKVFPDMVKENDLHLDEFLMTNLQYWLKRSSKIKFPVVDTNIDFKHNYNFIEVLIYIFSKFALEGVYNNPYNSYEEVEEEMSYLKGRLNIPEYMKSNISTGRWNHFSNIHEPFIYNNKVNKIIKYVSKMLLSVTKNSESSDKLKRILFILDEVDDIYCTENHCDGISINRFNKEYETILALCDMFLKHASISTCNNEKKLNFCFLIPMELLYEDFIYNFICEKYKDMFKEITKQKSNLYLTEAFVNDKFDGKAFNLKQDIYLKDLNNKVLILDTKYKVLNNNRNEKYGISQGDMYQMCSYALKGGYKELALIYPKACDLKDHIKFVINSGFGDITIKIDILQVSFVLDFEAFKYGENLEKLCKRNDELLMKDLRGLINNSEEIEELST